MFDCLGLVKGCNNLNTSRTLKNIEVFADKIKLSQNLRTPKNYAMLLLMLFPATIKKRRGFAGDSVISDLDHYFDQIKDKSYEIFKENNI
jgi:hypothetical protein